MTVELTEYQQGHNDGYERRKADIKESFAEYARQTAAIINQPTTVTTDSKPQDGQGKVGKVKRVEVITPDDKPAPVTPESAAKFRHEVQKLTCYGCNEKAQRECLKQAGEATDCWMDLSRGKEAAHV